MAASQPRLVTLRYAVERARDDWTLREEKVAVARPHHLRSTELEEQLAHWAARSETPMQVGQNLAVRWDEERPSIGVDPDVYVVTPPPPEGDEVTSLRLWETGHAPPMLAIEVVSAGHPTKDYSVAPEKYAASGTRELWVFDPELAGPRAHGGPLRIQIWCRDDVGDFARVYAGDGPARSPVLGAWVFAVDEGRRLRIADDEQGTSWWLTPTEAERAAKEAALARVAELEALLGGRRSP
jgi:Uma2 family endonuclease